LVLSCQILTLFRSGRCEELGEDKGRGGGKESFIKVEGVKERGRAGRGDWEWEGKKERSEALRKFLSILSRPLITLHNISSFLV
jgi:hypothetical protein